jgi:hypothetical protein
MKHLSTLLLGGLLGLAASPAWAQSTALGPLVVPGGSSIILNAAPVAADQNYYTTVEIQNGGFAEVSDAEYVQNLLVRTGGQLDFYATGEVQTPRNNGTTPSITLEPGAILQLVNPAGLPFAQGYRSISGIFVVTNPPYQLAISPAVKYIFSGSGPQTTAAPAPRITFNGTPVSAGVDLPATVGQLTTSNSSGLTLANTTSVSQVVHIYGGQLAVAPGATLTLLSTSAGTAVLDIRNLSSPAGLGSIVGNVAVQRYLDGSRFAGAGYRHLSSPVSGPTVASFGSATFTPTVNDAFNTAADPSLVAPYPTVFSYDPNRVDGPGMPSPASFDQGWVSPSSLTDALGEGRGYTVHTPANTTLTFEGTPRTSNVYLQFNFRGSDPAAGYQLLGNPYAAPLDWELVTQGNLFNNTEPTLYVFKASGPYAGSYSSYLPAAAGSGAALGVNGGTNVVPVSQGFFVRAGTVAVPSPPLLVFQPSYTLADFDTTRVQRSTTDPRALLRLRLHAATGQAHETLVYFAAAATAGLDATYDAAYLAGPGQQLALRTEAAGQGYSINGQPLLTGADVLLPLHLSATAAGTYTLTVDALSNLPAAYHAYLQDAATGTYTDLATTPNSSLTLAANTDNAGRYALLFSTQARVLATAPAVLAALVSLYPNPAHGTATLLLPAALRGTSATQVEILNPLGQVVRRTVQPAAAATLELSLDGLAAGLYTVRAHTAAGTVSRRLTVE